MASRKSRKLRLLIIDITGIAIIAGIIIVVLLFVLRMFMMGFAGLGMLGILFLLLGRLSSEEGVLLVLKRSGGSCKYNDRRISFNKRALVRLEKRGIVKIEDGIITLIVPDYPCIFDGDDSMNSFLRDRRVFRS
jgi:hypothetical protein